MNFMKFFVCVLAMGIVSVSAFGKDKNILVGSAVWISPEVGYDAIENAESDRVDGIEEEYNTTMGVSAEFVAPQPDGNFFSLGLDVFFKSRYKGRPSVKLYPMSLFANFGIMEPYCTNLNARIFAGIGGMVLNYKTRHYNAEFGDSIGLMYQFGAGIITSKFFVDILMRGGSGSLERDFEGIDSKSEADYFFTTAMLKVGLVF